MLHFNNLYLILIDLISILVDKLNRSGGNVLAGGYTGYIRFLFTIGGKRSSVNLKYHHGSGGNAPVTRGVIQTNRQSVFLPDADIVVNGHNHQAYIVPIPRERLSIGGKIYKDYLWHIRTPGYKDEWQEQDGWAVEKNGGPTSQGAAWLKFTGVNQRVEVLAHLDTG